MKVDTMIEAAMAEFKQNLRGLCEGEDLSDLTPQLAEKMSARIRQSVASAGVASYRAFLLSYDAEQDEVWDARGEKFKFKDVRNKTYMTPFGSMDLPRRCYQNSADTKSYMPLDAAWGMEKRYITPEVLEAVLFSCALVTPEETVQLLEKCALFRPHASTIKRAVRETGEALNAHRETLDAAVRAEETVPEGTRAVVVSADGATVLMKEKGVHFGRPAERPGGEKPQETPTAYRVAMVGSISHYGAPEAPGQRPERLQSRYVAHMPERCCPTFKRLLEEEVDDMAAGVPEGTPRILLLDGARELWNYFDKNPRYDHYHRCIDFWHAVEHLSVAAEALFGSGEKAKRWYKKYRRLLKETDDGAKRILRSIDYFAPKHKRSKTSEKHLNEARTYFRRNGKRMTYATFRQNGWPIGSGPIEAACKTLIKTRMCRSGMRWTRDGGQHILNLRTYVKSNRWNAVWPQIKQLEYAA